MPEGNGPSLGSSAPGRWWKAGAAVAAFACLALTAGRLLGRAPRAERARPPFSVHLENAEPVEPEEEPAEPRSSLTPARLPAPPMPTFAEFVAAMKRRLQETPAAEEAAKKFQEEFEKQVALKQVFDDFKADADRGGRRPAIQFLDALDAKPEFHGLLSRFSANPGAETVYGELSRDSFLAPLLKRVFDRAAAPGVSKPASPAGKASDPVAQRPQANRFAGTGVAVHGPGSMADPPTGSRSSEAREPPSTSPTPAQSGQDGARADRRSGGGSPGAHQVAVKLDQGHRDSYTSERMARLFERYPCLANIDQPFVEHLIQTNDIRLYGLWGTCFAQKRYGACKRAGCSTTPMSGWDACKEWKGPGPSTDAICRAECRAQAPDCVVPRIPTVVDFKVPATGGASDKLEVKFLTEDATHTEAGTCWESGNCDAKQRWGMPTCGTAWDPPMWAGPTEKTWEWEPGTYGGGCCFQWRLRACDGSNCSEWTYQRGCFTN